MFLGNFHKHSTRVFNRKKGIEALKNNLIASIQEQEDPTKRKVRSFTQLKNEDGLWEVTVVSDFDGWAEDEKHLFTTVKKLPDLTSNVSLTETSFYKKFYGDDFQELLRALELLYSEEDNSEEGDDGCRYFKRSHLSDYCEMLCNGELITSGGQCNWSMIKALNSKGYDVFAGDRDSFGWLTGCVQKDGDDRILVYG